MSRVIKRYCPILALTSIVAASLFACGGSSGSSSSTASSVTSDQGTPTTLVTALNGQSSHDCAQNLQCMDFSTPISFGTLGQIAGTLSQAATSWTNTSTNIITISGIPYVDGSNEATTYDSHGSVFVTTTDLTTSIPGYPTPGIRVFAGNGLPSTKMGTFPVQSGTAAYAYYSSLPGGTNPNTGQAYSSAAAIGISPYVLASAVPLNPVATGYYPVNSLIVGVTLTGAVWHAEYANDASGNWYSPVNALPLDQCWGHPYSQQYHHHGYSWKCFPNQGTSGQSPVFGFALDGFPITGPRAGDSHMITNAELDKCHGTTSTITMPDGASLNTYHYVLNREYPYSVGCFRGVVNYDLALGPPGPNLGMKEGVPYPTVSMPNPPVPLPNTPGGFNRALN